MPFREAFQQTELADHIEPGIRALGQYSRLIECNTPNQLEGSIDMDSSLTYRYPQDNRWDYAFGYDARIYYVEVHPVSDSQVSVVIAKYQWLKDWQNRQRNPHELKSNSQYYWISSGGGGGLTKNSRYVRSLARAGLGAPAKKLRL